MSYRRLELIEDSAPSVLSVAEFKAGAHITRNVEDSFITGLVVAAQTMVENHTGLSLSPKTFKLHASWWPGCCGLVLMYPPATEVVKVEYLANDDGLLHTLAASTYVADIAGNLRPTLGLAYGQTWPSLWPHPAPVHVTYKAGYPAGLCPRPLIEGIRMIAQDLYENREDKITVMIGERQVIPNQMMTRILAPYTLWEM